jgi:hypothetical protein
MKLSEIFQKNQINEHFDEQQLFTIMQDEAQQVQQTQSVIPPIQMISTTTIPLTPSQRSYVLATIDSKVMSQM